jgi:hypothetical protein
MNSTPSKMSYEGLSVAESSSNSKTDALISDFVKIYDQIIPEEVCDEMVNYLENSDKNFIDHDYLRRNERALFPNQNPELYNKVVNVIRNVYQKYKQDIGPVSSNLYPANHLEYPMIACYKPNPERKEQFSDHADAWHLDSCSRQISIIIYLGDVEEGGCTTFTYFDKKVKPVKGRILIFPSNFMYMHRAEPPISNPKYVCICWIHFDGKTTYASLKI